MFVAYFAVLTIGFASLYLALSRLSPGAFVPGGEHPWLDYWFFSVSTATTTAFAGLYPVVDLSRGFVTAEIFASVWLIIVQILNMTLVAAPRAREVSDDMAHQVFTVRNLLLETFKKRTGRSPSDGPIDLDK
jgi:hypothetical protein